MHARLLAYLSGYAGSGHYHSAPAIERLILNPLRISGRIKESNNKKKGIRYCVWLAPDEDTLKSIFSELEISWDSMVEVEETVPDLWGKKCRANLLHKVHNQ